MVSKHWCLGGLFVLCVLCLIGCKRDPDSMLGDNIHNDNDLTEGFQDTIFEIIAYSIPDSSLVVQNPSRVLLGAVNDNVFGSAEYNLFTQLDYSISNSSSDEFILGVSTIDSIILTLPYSDLYPTSRSDAHGRAIKLKIHELTEKILKSSDKDSLYNINSSIDYDPNVLSGNEFTILPRPFDSIYDSVSGSRSVSPIKVKLSKEFGARLLSRPSGSYLTDGAFSEDYNGICIIAQPCANEKESSVVAFAVSSTSVAVIKIEVFYDNVLGTKTKSKLFSMGPVRFTQVKRNINTSNDMAFKAQMRGDTSYGKQFLYVEASGGAVVKFKLPNLKEVFKSNEIIVNKADLILPVVTAENPSGMETPKALQIDGIADNSYNPQGKYNSSDGAYHLNLTRQLQSMIYKDADPSELFNLTTSISERYGTPTRISLYGPKGGAKKMKLRVIYTTVAE